MCATETTTFTCLSFNCKGVIQRNIVLPPGGGYSFSRPVCSICGRMYLEAKYRDAAVSEESISAFHKYNNKNNK